MLAQRFKHQTSLADTRSAVMSQPVCRSTQQQILAYLKKHWVSPEAFDEDEVRFTGVCVLCKNEVGRHDQGAPGTSRVCAPSLVLCSLQ